MSPPTYFQLRWESTGDQWWYASPIDWAAAYGGWRRCGTTRSISTMSTWCRSEVARRLLIECEMEMGRSYLIGGGHGGWLLYTAASAGDAGFVQELLERDPLHVYAAARSKSKEVFKMVLDFAASPRFAGAGKDQGGEIQIGFQHVSSSQSLSFSVNASCKLRN